MSVALLVPVVLVGLVLYFAVAVVVGKAIQLGDVDDEGERHG